jgi:GH25 family lysozyme M1 (1,4-beta-N-acetylmuramidase)
MNSFTYTDFYNQYLGQSSSLGGYRNQCVTLFKCFLEKVGYPDPGRAIGGSGGAREIWYRKDALGYGDYFEYTQVGQPGDWFIWDSVYGWYEGTYYGHVAMLIQDNGNGTGQFLGMNQDYNLAPASVQTLTYNGSCGVLHYKGYGTASNSTSSTYSDADLIDEHAIATLTADVNKRRDTPTGLAVETLKSGTVLEYTQKYVGNGHRYISFVEHQSDGASYRYFVAVNGNEDGTDPWATFSACDDSSVSSGDELTEEHGWAKFKVDQVNIRKGSTSGDVAGQVNSGDVVEYHWKTVTDSHRYIVKEENGEKYFIACSPTNERSTEWADFYGEDPSASDNNTGDGSTSSIDTSNVKHWGVDISEHNGADFDVSSYDFVIIRASYGEHTDPQLETNVNKCKAAGVPYGLYHYSYAINDEESTAETNYFLDLAKQYGAPLGVWLDMEDADNYKQKNGVLDRGHVLAFTKNFCKLAKEAGYYVGIYSSTWWFDNYLNEGLDDYDKWVAQWDSNDGSYSSDTSGRGSIHQYTSIDKDTGAAIDKNAMYVDFDHYATTDTGSSDTTPDDNKGDDSGTTTPDSNTTDSAKTDTLIDLLIKLIKKLLKLFKK